MIFFIEATQTKTGEKVCFNVNSIRTIEEVKEVTEGKKHTMARINGVLCDESYEYIKERLTIGRGS